MPSFLCFAFQVSQSQVLYHGHRGPPKQYQQVGDPFSDIMKKIPSLLGQAMYATVERAQRQTTILFRQWSGKARQHSAYFVCILCIPSLTKMHKKIRDTLVHVFIPSSATAILSYTPLDVSSYPHGNLGHLATPFLDRVTFM